MDSIHRTPLRVTDASSEPTLQAAKWLQHQVLLDSEELKNLFNELKNFEIYTVGSIVKIDEGQVSKNTFLKEYAAYIETLKCGQMPNISSIKKAFTVVLTSTPEALFAYSVSPSERLIRVAHPIIQVQAHFMHYSGDDNKFRPMVFGPDCITWGLQFSYPQIYLDAESKQIVKVSENEHCINNELYRKLQLWLRTNTRPTPMVIDHTRINIPIRLGLNCFSWVNRHPQLQEKSIHVLNPELEKEK